MDVNASEPLRRIAIVGGGIAGGMAAAADETQCGLDLPACGGSLMVTPMQVAHA
ncbi:hypothetical protein JR064_02515 [Xanthomonas sp. CFBP 8703]|uniref:Uncharacterized protein n=1 Tax=Xanthomonas bonasiae TaxID=2810351 RepID=A0ABS3AXG2_9XANT|nr:hypothetical protein [Xanthomonas bonasiae]MBN6101037.1 hypothetical protein [Xanthomonas bonasiae]